MTSQTRDSMIRYGLLVVLAAMVVLFAVLETSFLRVGNVFIILQSVSIVALLALGVTTSMVVGGFDLSIGSVAAASLMASAYAMVVWKLGTVETIFFCLAIGLAVGAVNAFLIVKLRIPDLLATLGMMFLIVGLQLIPTGGRSIASGMQLPSGAIANGSFQPSFLMLGRYRIADVVPVPVVIMIVLAVATWVFLERTRWGRMMYAIGGNEQAARLAGANVSAYKFTAYMISSLYAAIGGILLAARVGRGDVSSGNSLLLDSVAAALIGFAVLGAKKPNAFGTAIGALFVGVLLNGLTMLNAPYYTQDFVKGLVLVLALAFTFGIASRVR
ncbi:ABC transporter permease [Phreatobacter stygius]|uniref:ABC transporter permease n=1 Tax=Phreatobacter stygius TaxID=1940610 RepID=A0A4D7AW15_9HYPH|nr:ABC transporter permease [Phreatobacter stygius]QCI63735.1 ABC transporter permease [Phreatobacter stygius]